MQGNVLLALTRPAKVMKSKVIVQDGRGAEVGQIVQQNVIGKIRFGLEADGHTYGSINAENWRAWNFHVAGPHRHRGRPHHQDLGGPRQDALHHRRQLRGADPPPARGARCAPWSWPAALAVDTALKQDNRGFG